MATTLGSPTWGSGPAIPCRWTYDRRRNGAAMEYRVYGYVNTDQATRHFGYYIDASVSISGASSYSTRLKENSPSQWSGQLTFDTGWKTVSNKTSGTTGVTITLSTNAPRGASSWSYTMAVDPAGSTLNAPNGTLGDEQTLTLTRYSSNFTDSLSWACGSASGTLATKSSATSFSFTPALTLAEQAPSANSVTITYTISTYDGNTLVQTQTKTATYTIPDTVKPTAALAISDAAGYEQTYGGYVQTKSRLRMQITGTPAYGSPIASYTSAADGTTYSGADVTTPALSQTGAQTATATVTDSRGRVSDPATQAYTVLAYTAPQITKMTASRCDQNGNQDPTGHYGIAIFSAAITPLNNVNTAAYKLRYKKTSANTWTETTLTTYAGQYSVSDGQAIFPADDDSAYDVQIVAEDDFGSAAIASGIPVAFAIINWNNDGDGMAIGGISTKAGLQVYMDSEFIGDADHLGDIKKNGVSIFPISVANGGTGQTSIPAFLNAIATEYTDTGTVTGETRRTKTWTVSGSGILFVFGMTACDTTNSYGSTIVEIKQGSTVVAGEHARTDTRSGAAVTASTAIMLKVTNGTTVTVEGYSTKGGTKTVTVRALAFGCTLS